MITLLKTVKASEFKAKCLRLMDQVAKTGQPLIITKNGKPVAQLGPVVVRATTLAGAHAGKSHILGDIIAPIDVDWEAER